MENKKRKNKRFKFTITITLLFLILFIFMKCNYKQSSIEDDFRRLLEDSGYGFKGRVIKLESIGKEGGIICLDQIEINDKSPHNLLFRNQIVSKISNSRIITHIGVIFFTNEKGNITYKLEPGDVVQYNLNGDGYYKIFRNNELILRTNPIVYNTKISKKFDNYKCP